MRCVHAGRGFVELSIGYRDLRLVRSAMKKYLNVLASVILCIAAPLAVHDVNAQCGNGILESGEECDDGNMLPCDGCDTLCKFEIFISCVIETSGDVNVSGAVSSADIIYCVGYVFKSGPEPLPHVSNGDVNCDGQITAGDIIYLVGHVFKGGFGPCDICNFSPLCLPSGFVCDSL